MKRKKMKAQISRLKTFLRRIDIDYRQSSGMTIEEQAYCMRSEVGAALCPQDEPGVRADIERLRQSIKQKQDSPASPPN